MGSELRRGQLLDRAAMQTATEVLQRLGASFTPSTLVSSLSIAEQQQVEIARALKDNKGLDRYLPMKGG
jgi:ribose transport system ATP-binding protein